MEERDNFCTNTCLPVKSPLVSGKLFFFAMCGGEKEHVILASSTKREENVEPYCAFSQKFPFKRKLVLVEFRARN